MADERVAPLLKRAFIFLEDGDWIRADEYCEKVLDIDPENAEAYLGKLMAETRARKREILSQCNLPFVASLNYQKIMRFGNDELKEEIEGYIKAIIDRNELNRLEGIYINALNAMNSSVDENGFKAAANIFASISTYKNSAELAETCVKRAETVKLDGIYNYAYSLMKTAADENTFKAAAGYFNSISGYKDAAELAEFCMKKSETVQLDAVYDYAYNLMKSANNETAYKTAAEYFKSISSYKDAAELAETCVKNAETVRLEGIYIYAYNLMNSTTDIVALKAAAEQFKSIGDYKNSAELAEFCIKKAENIRLNGIYNHAVSVMKSGANENSFKAAAEIFKTIPGYLDADELAEKCLKNAEVAYKDRIFFMAKSNIAGENPVTYENAVKMLESIPEWRDSKDLIAFAKKRIEEIKEKEEQDRIERERLAELAAIAKKKRKKKIKIISILSTVLVCAIAAAAVAVIFYVIPNNNYDKAVALLNDKKYSEAIDAFEELDGFKDSDEKIKVAKYAQAISLMNEEKYGEAQSVFESLGDYKDSADKAEECKANASSSSDDTDKVEGTDTKEEVTENTVDESETEIYSEVTDL